MHDFFFQVKPSARIFFSNKYCFFLSEIFIHYLFLCFINYSSDKNGVTGLQNSYPDVIAALKVLLELVYLQGSASFV